MQRLVEVSVQLLGKEWVYKLDKAYRWVEIVGTVVGGGGWVGTGVDPPQARLIIMTKAPRNSMGLIKLFLIYLSFLEILCCKKMIFVKNGVLVTSLP